MKDFKKFRRAVAMLLSVFMIFPMVAAVPVSAETGNTSYEYDGYTVEYKIINEWAGNQNIEVNITNTSDEPILNWALKYDAKGEISGLWNGTMYANTNTAYLIKNAGYNYEIAPNQSVNFGYTLSGESLSFPESFELCAKRVDVAVANYTTSLSITEEWDTGFKGELILTNISSSPIEAWKISFDGSFELTDLWNGKLLEGIDGRYTVASEMWSNPIQPNSSVAIGIVGTKVVGAEIIADNFALSQIVIEDQIPEIPVDEDDLILAAFGEYASDTNIIKIRWFSTIPDGTFEIFTSDDNVTYTAIGSVDNSDNFSLIADFTKKYIKVSQTTKMQSAESDVFVATQTPTGYAIDFLDGDNDRLVDFVENTIGSDSLNSDTDGDGLSDYEEASMLGTDPLVYDSVTPGISDSEADCDNDGLSNRYELDNGTNPSYADTDNDGLKDGEEVNTYTTDPLIYDTDGDGASDGWEVTEGYNPLVYDELFSISQSAEGENITAKVDAELKGEQIETLSVSVIDGSPFLNFDTPGYIGSAFDFSVSGEITEATLSFTFDAALLEDDTFIPAIYYFNEETQLLEELETTVAGNTATAKTTHFSQYILLNKHAKTDFEESYEGSLKTISTDVVFVIDYSLSMDWNDPDGLRIDVTNDFIDNLPVKDKAGVVAFIKMPTILSELSNNKTELNAIVSGITNDSGYTTNSGTNGSAGIYEAINVLEGSTASNKCIVFLTDGEDTIVSYAYDTLAATAKEKKIKIYSVALGAANAAILSSVAEGTGGKFYSASSSLDLSDIYGDIENEVIDRQIDSNNDGITDYETKMLCENTIYYGTGAKNCFVGMSYDDINNDTDGDFDNDGLKNGEEMKVTISSSGRVYVTMTSYPTKEDSDGDGLLDGKRSEVNGKIIAPSDPNPIKYDGPNGVWMEHIATAEAGSIPTGLVGWYGYTQPTNNLPNVGAEGIYACIQEMIYLVKEGKITFTNTNGIIFLTHVAELCLAFESSQNTLDDSMSKLVDCLQATEPSEEIKNEIAKLQQQVEADYSAYSDKQSAIQIMLINMRDYVAEGEDADKILASLGSRLLNFKSDSNGIIHSQHYTWQAPGGYSNLYDGLFRKFTNGNMDREKFPFTIGDTQYILWAWRGDYLNLGAGAEIGIYSRPTYMAQDPNGLDHYFADTSLTMPMQLYLYNDYGSSNIENIFSWQPTEEQWWITGFNPEHVGIVDMTKQVMVASVDFSEFTDASGKNEMYDELKEQIQNRKAVKEFVIFDEDNRTVWIMWYEGV